MFVLPALNGSRLEPEPMAIQLLLSLATYGPRTLTLLKSIPTNLRIVSG